MWFLGQPLKMSSTSFTFAGRDCRFSAYRCFGVTNHIFSCLSLNPAVLSARFAFLPWKTDGEMEKKINALLQWQWVSFVMFKSTWCEGTAFSWLASAAAIQYLLKSAEWKWHGETDMTEWRALLNSNLWICLSFSDTFSLTIVFSPALSCLFFLRAVLHGMFTWI